MTGEVGVDIEQLRILQYVDQLAQRHLTDEERQGIHEDAEPSYSHSFIRYWSRKEAYIKALGTGLSQPPSSFTVKRGAHPEQWLVTDHTATHSDPAAIIQDISLPGYAGAAAVCAHHARFTVFKVPEAISNNL